MLPAKKPIGNNRYVEELVQSTSSSDCADIDEQIVFPDEVTELSLVWNINGQDFTKVFSALNYGADFAYPSDAIGIVAKFLEMVCTDMTLCEAVADCITNSSETGSAIIEFMQQNGYGSGGQTNTEPSPLSTSITAQNLLPTGYTCDESHLCGMSRWIVTNLHDGVLQLLSQLEIATNTWELIATFVDNVEVVSWLGSVLEFALWAQDQLLEYYDAAYSATVEDDLTCDIYCIIEPVCEVTIDNLIQAYENAIVSSFTLPGAINEVASIWNWLEGLDYEFANAKAVVASFHWAILQFLRFGSSALNYTRGIRSFEQMIATGVDETDTYCVSDCDCDEPIAYSQNFGVGLGEWTIEHGTQVAGGIESVEISGTQQIHLYIEFDEAFRVAGFSSVINRVSGGSVNDDMRLYQNNNEPPDATGQVLDYNFPSGARADMITCNTGLGSASRTGLKVIYRDNGATEEMTLKSIKIWNSAVALPTNITPNSDGECYT